MKPNDIWKNLKNKTLGDRYLKNQGGIAITDILFLPGLLYGIACSISTDGSTLIYRDQNYSAYFVSHRMRRSKCGSVNWPLGKADLGILVHVGEERK